MRIPLPSAAADVEHPDTLQAMQGLAVAWRSQQQSAKALAMMQECFQLQRQKLGLGHPARDSYKP